MKTLLYANRAVPKSISVISILLLAAAGDITKLRCMQSWAVSPIQYLLRQIISIVDTCVFVFVSIIKITKVFVIVSISHK